MKITGKVHCFFEQSGTFKNEFIKLGIPAEDLFKAIEDAYDGKPSLFDNIRGGQDGDLIFAFFPCIKFCSVMEQMQHEDFYDAGQKRRKDFGTEEFSRKIPLL